MKNIYFVTEGTTDKIVLEGLIELWLDGEDFIPTHVQPPESAYAAGLDTKLSNGWQGVFDWCAGKRPAGPAGLQLALSSAHCLVVHMDADVASDEAFHNPAYAQPCPPAKGACDWVRERITSLFDGGILPPNVVLCVPSKDLEAWILCALHPDVADKYLPIECRASPGALLIQLQPRLVRQKAGTIKKDTDKYRTALNKIVAGWSNCVGGPNPRCPEAVRFENEARDILGA